MEKSIKKITQYFPTKSLGKQTIEIIDDKLVLNWNDLFASYQTSFDMNDINPNYDVGRQEFDNWGNLCWFFLCVFVVISLFPFLKPYDLIPLGIAFIFLLFKFKRYDWVHFWDTRRVIGFSVRYSGDILAKKAFVENLVREIEKARS